MGYKFNVNQSTINRQIKKLGIKNHAREKTLKHIEESSLKANKRRRELKSPWGRMIG